MKALKICIVISCLCGLIASCTQDNFQETDKESVSYEELRQSMQKTIIPTDIDTLSMTFDTLDLFLHQYVVEYYLDNKCIVEFHVVDVNQVEFLVIPKATQLGQLLQQEIINLSNAKMACYSNKDYNEVSAWAKKEADAGRHVVISKEKNGTYTAISYTKLEWAILMMKLPQ